MALQIKCFNSKILDLYFKAGEVATRASNSQKRKLFAINAYKSSETAALYKAFGVFESVRGAYDFPPKCSST